MSTKPKPDDKPVGLLPEDYEAIGEDPPKKEELQKEDIRSITNNPESTEASRQHMVYAALDKLLPGNQINDAELEALFTFARDRMNNSDYSLMLATFLKKGASFQLTGGDIRDCCMLLDIMQLQHHDRLNNARTKYSKGEDMTNSGGTNWAGLLGKLKL